MDAHNLIPVEKNPNIEEFGPGDTVVVNVRVGLVTVNAIRTYKLINLWGQNLGYSLIVRGGWSP